MDGREQVVLRQLVYLSRFTRFLAELQGFVVSFCAMSGDIDTMHMPSPHNLLALHHSLKDCTEH